MRMLDLFCGRWGWSRAFAARGWECVGVDIVEPPEIPPNCHFFCADILSASVNCYYKTINLNNIPCTIWPDFICVSSPCEEFSIHGMKHFFPNPGTPMLE